MNVTSVEFGSYLTYAPWGRESIHYKSKSVKRELKGDLPTAIEPQFSKRIAKEIKYALATVALSDFFDQNPWLVPIPRSSKLGPDTLWAPRKITTAMQSVGLGQSVECLERKFLVSTSRGSAESRNALRHYESMAVNMRMSPNPWHILLVDDIITSGATSLRATNRIQKAFPNANVRVFAVMRTMSTPSDFRAIVDDCTGRITLRDDYTKNRMP